MYQVAIWLFIQVEPPIFIDDGNKMLLIDSVADNNDSYLHIVEVETTLTTVNDHIMLYLPKCIVLFAYTSILSLK